ncbi:protein-disulfide reductase DsbD domain-containing protein [Psychrobacter frigidicola]|uniref:cytochrome c biogenesis protein CcdA n=1 Tax=Psychrobacter frigidicola TaxID=45611 RepID=UPI001918D1B9|nr:protein-disulfide reductase DsbD domain-containing protein [Psychrobacter frigidicola]
MSIKTPTKKSSLTKKTNSKKSYIFALAVASTSLMTGLTATTMTTQAAGLGDLFSSDQSGAQKKFLPVDQAFQVGSTTKAVANGTRLSINFDITPEHYVYKDQIKLTLPAGVSAAPFTFSQKPVSIDDPTFGQVPVFDQANMVATTILTNSSGKSVSNGAVVIGWQGCAKAGLCYPPEKIKTTVNIATTPQKAATAPVNAVSNTNASSNSKTDAAKATATANSEQKNTNTADNAVNTITGADTTTDTEQPLQQGNDTDGTLGDDGSLNSTDLESTDISDTNTISGADSSMISGADSNTISGADTANSSDVVAGNNLEESDPFGLAKHPWLALVLLFLAGLGLAFTPCVLPMLPIVANIVARQQNPTVKKGVILTTSYAIGVSIAYGILGAVIAVFGESLGIIGWLQNPIILISFAIIFVLLALYMLGIFSIRLPRFITSKMQGLSQAGDSKLGSAGGSLAAGFLSALVVSPCVSAPLFGALLAVSTIGSPLLGFAALFMLGFGLSAPLILIGATQGSIMPKAGEWMNWVKQGFALLLFAVALLLIERVFISPVMLLVWALWFMVVATWAWSWLGKGRILTQALGLVAGIWAATLIIGAALGNDDSLHPLASLSAAPMSIQSIGGQSMGGQATNVNNASDEKITTLAELDAITAANPKVLVDLTADWCVECRIMDKNLFHNRPAQMQGWQLVRLDITDTTADSKAILARYKLFGPPTLLYYQDGQLVNKQVGEIGREEFEQTLTALNK